MMGESILHYKIVERLGGGGMGEVYRARDTRLDRDVALKFLPEELRDDPEARERLIREAQAASKLHHPHIVSIFAIEEADGRHFLVMEYVRGRTLSDVIREGLTVEKVYNLGRQIGEALRAAHEAGIVHRDIKSDNILVTDRGEAKVLDFGLAKLKGSTKITEAGSTLGTIAYMSPEQTQGKDVDHRSDIFSFGVILYEMVAGQLPFKGEHAAALTYEIVNSEPEPLARYKSGVTAELQRIVDKALRKDPGGRYQSVADMLADMNVEATSRHPTYVTPTKRRLKPVAYAGIGVLIIALAFIIVRTLPPERQPPVASEGGGRVMLAVLPFQNLGSPEDEYFADGITEEITTHLARLSGLGVISRTSAMAYKGTSKSIREIGSELDVDYILEGTIRWDRSGTEQRVRVNPQLIKVSDDTHLWADTYDRVLKEIFALQTDIAEKVAAELNVTLLEPEKVALRAEPTEDIEAYQYYLRGRDYYYTLSNPSVDRENAFEMFKKAVDLDPEFAAPQMWLARLYANDYFNRRRLENNPLEKARAAAEKAQLHSKNGPEGHIAWGYYHYYASRDYDRALKEFALAQKLQPNNSDLLEATGYVLRRQGRWEEALESLRAALALDPRAMNIRDETIDILVRMRRWNEANALIQRQRDLNPHYWVADVWHAMIAAFEEGDIATARERAAAVEGRVPPDLIGFFKEQLDYLAGDLDAALSRRPGPRDREVFGLEPYAYHVNHALYAELAGKKSLARAHADSALQLVEERLESDDDARLYPNVAIARAILGQRELAMQDAERALEIMPMSRDAVAGADVLGTIVVAYIILGEYEIALDHLEFLLSVPAFVNKGLLELTPAFDPIRDHPRFQDLLRKAERINL